MTFGDRLRESRLKKGLTQEQLAQQIGVAKSTLTGYEKGNREPDVFKIRKILEALEVDSDYLLGVTRTEKSPPEPDETPDPKELEKTMQILMDAFTKAGYIGENGDISDSDFKMLRAIVDILDSHFNNSSN